MSIGRLLTTVAVLFVVVPHGNAETYTLAEAVKAADCFDVQLDMKLSGEMRIRRGDKYVPMPMEASGTHHFAERVLSVGADGLTDRAARVYAKAEATIAVNGDRSARTLRPERKLVVVQRGKDQPLVFSPTGPLRYEELGLTSEHFDTLTLAGLLPGKAVAIGDTWKIGNAVAQAVCNFEGLTEQSLSGKLLKADANVATFEITGLAGGIDQGALVKLTVQATGQFDLKAKRLVSLDWKQSDEREQGPVSPASHVQATTTLKRQAIDQPSNLSDVALVSVPSDDKVLAALTQLDYHDSKDRFDLLYSREWQIVSQTKEHVVLRLMERGDFIAQATLTPWPAAAKGKHLDPTDFKATMEQTPGWEPQKELQTGEVPIGDGLWAYRLSFLGKLDGVDVMQNYFIVAAPSGDQMVVTFTMTPKQADKLGSRDLALIGGLGLPALKK